MKKHYISGLLVGKGHLKVLNDIDNELKEKIWNDNQFWPF